MEALYNGYTLELCPGAFPLSTDSMVLAHFARLPRGARVLDLGSGCGTLGMLLCARDEHCRVTGVELSQAAHGAAQENIRRNGLQHRLESICADLRSFDRLFSPGSFDICLSNPPYFPGGPASKAVPLARREDMCTMAELMRAASYALKYGGDFYLVHRPERLAELMHQACQVQLEPKRLCLLRHRPDAPVSLVLAGCRKGGRPGLIWEELCLHNADGTPSEAYRQIYHL